MKLESLNSKKFEAFKANEITNAITIRGGQRMPTVAAKGTVSDCWDTGTGKGGYSRSGDVTDITWGTCGMTLGGMEVSYAGSASLSYDVEDTSHPVSLELH